MKMTSTVLFLLCLTALAYGSPNGPLYRCNVDKLASDKLCIFERTDGVPLVGPVNLDRSVGADGFRIVLNEEKTRANISPKPFFDGWNIAGSTVEITGNDWGYVRVFELMAPLRDALMYFPDQVNSDPSRLTALLKPLVDCGIKNFEVSTFVKGQDKNGNDITDFLYGTSGIANLIKAPESDIKDYILQFLEESSLDLLCLIADKSFDTHCTTIRANLAEGQSSTCMEAAWSALPTVLGETTTTTATPTPTPTTSPASGASSSATPSTSPAAAESASTTPAPSASTSPAVVESCDLNNSKLVKKLAKLGDKLDEEKTGSKKADKILAKMEKFCEKYGCQWKKSKVKCIEPK